MGYIIFDKNGFYDFDIEKMYTDVIKSIDSIRSIVNIEEISKTFDEINKLSESAQEIKILSAFEAENIVQESRCHAYYRMLGLPVVSDIIDSSGNNMYSPGFDGIKCKEQRTDLSNKIKICLAQSKNIQFKEISNKREGFIHDNLEVFSKSNSISSGLLALTSGGTQRLRKFASPFIIGNSLRTIGQSSDSFIETEGLAINDSKYATNLNASVGNKLIPLTEFQGSSGESAGDLKDWQTIGMNRSHIITPFIVDGRIDFSVLPQANLIAVPFVITESDMKVSATKKVNRPIIEEIIRNRFFSLDASNILVAEALDNLIKELPEITHDIINSIAISFGQNLTNSFIDSINIIRTMIIKLVEAENNIKVAQHKYYWIPMPSKSGPENIIGSQKFEANISEKSANLVNNLFTKHDMDIFSAQLKIKSKKIVQNISDKSFPIPGNFGPTASDFDNEEVNLQSLLNNRNKAFKEAENSLRIIEIIMGEFSGLGLCDIIAIQGALNIMDKDKLLGLIDESAFLRFAAERAIEKAEFKTERNKNINECLTHLNKLVKYYYDLMDKVYEDYKRHHNVL